MSKKQTKRVKGPDEWTQVQFDGVVENFPEFGFEVREALRSIMVLGKSQSEVARTLGLTRQRVNQMVNALRTRHRPVGWVTAAVTVPPDVMKQIRQMERQAREQFERQRTQL